MAGTLLNYLNDGTSDDDEDEFSSKKKEQKTEEDTFNNIIDEYIFRDPTVPVALILIENMICEIKYLTNE